jgi:hypothetical protein
MLFASFLGFLTILYQLKCPLTLKYTKGSYFHVWKNIGSAIKISFRRANCSEFFFNLADLIVIPVFFISFLFLFFILL